MKNKQDEPLWMQMYREEVIKPQQRQRQTEQHGRTAASRAGFYTSKAWITVRNQRRRNNPLCQRCEPKGYIKPGKVVDHIIPVDEAPELALVYDNTQHLCNRCNDFKTKQDAKAKKKRDKLRKGKQLMKEAEQKNTDG